MITTCWLIGSTSIPEIDIEIDGQLLTFAAGGRYLYHPTDALSLITILSAHVASEVIDGEAYLGKDRRVRVAGASSFDLTWPTPLAALFGFAGNLSGQATYTAPSVSPLLWSPGKTESPQESPLGTLGRSVYDTRFGTSPDGYQVADSHHTQKINQFTWTHIPTARFQTTAQDTGATGTIQGEYTRFFDVVLRNGAKFHLWRLLGESLTTDATPQAWSGQHLGPYGYRTARGVTWDFQRSTGFATVDRYNNVTIDTIVVPEYEVT
ncbi:MAG: hypothetical protein JNL82_29905 [Myxococcales bacterium]|nr:hypothetical protein [Myxococcales bacterium]